MLKEPRIYEVVRFKQRFLKNEEEILPPWAEFPPFAPNVLISSKGLNLFQLLKN